MKRKGSFVLDGKALSLAGAVGRALALEASSLGRSFPTFSAAPASIPRSARAEDGGEEDDEALSGVQLVGNVGLVRVVGPLGQRGQLQLCGAIDGYDWVTARLASALSASSVEAVVMVIDSPGGDGAGLAEAVGRMRAMCEAADKPCLAYVDEMAASAAYWIAAGVCDAVYLPSTGRVGSIGAIAVHVDESAALEAEGLKVTIVRSPEGKAAGMPLEPLGDTGRARIERAVSELADGFVAAMADRRGVSKARLRALDADMLTGADAVRARLADGVATLEETISKAAGAAAERQAMLKLKEAVGQVFRMSATASDDAMAATVAAGAPLVDLGRCALALAGGGDPVEATKALSAWHAAHVREQAEAPKREAAAKTRRVTALQALSAKLGPAVIKLDAGLEISTENAAEPFASMSTEQLEAFASRPTAAPSIAEADPKRAAAHADQTGELSDAELEVCRLLGQTPEDFRSHKAALAARSN